LQSSHLWSSLTLEPGWKTLTQAELNLRGLIHWHLVLILAAQLSEGTDTLVDPLVAIDLDTARSALDSIVNNVIDSYLWRRQCWKGARGGE